MSDDSKGPALEAEETTKRADPDACGEIGPETWDDFFAKNTPGPGGTCSYCGESAAENNPVLSHGMHGQCAYTLSGGGA